MICVVNTGLTITDMLIGDYPRDGERKAYPWSRIGDKWTDVKPLWYAKKAKLDELRNCRDAEDPKPVTTEKGTFDFDLLSQTRINNAIMLTGETETREWTRADGVIIQVTKRDLIDIIKTAAIRSDVFHERWLELEQRVNEAQTVEAVEKIKWEDEDVND